MHFLVFNSHNAFVKPCHEGKFIIPYEKFKRPHNVVLNLVAPTIEPISISDEIDLNVLS